jgi:hypothetical protein
MSNTDHAQIDSVGWGRVEQTYLASCTCGINQKFCRDDFAIGLLDPLRDEIKIL